MLFDIFISHDNVINMSVYENDRNNSYVNDQLVCLNDTLGVLEITIPENGYFPKFEVNEYERTNNEK